MHFNNVIFKAITTIEIVILKFRMYVKGVIPILCVSKVPGLFNEAVIESK